MTATLSRPKPAAPRLDGPPLPPTPPPGRRNRTRIGLGAGVLALSILGTVALYGSASDRTEVLTVRNAVPAGKAITAGDLATAELSAHGGIQVVAAADQVNVVGQIATVALVPGSLLTPGQFAEGPRLAEGMAVTGATLQPGQYPLGLQPGDRVRLIETPAPTATGNPAPIDRGVATVEELAAVEDATGSMTVDLIVPAEGAAAIATAGAAGRLNLVVIGAAG